MPPLARVVQEDGKLLVQAVLEVRKNPKHVYMPLMLQSAALNDAPDVKNMASSFSRASGVGHPGASWTSLQKCFSVSTRTAFLCWLCGWKRCCSLLVSHRHGSHLNRRTTSHSRYSGTLLHTGLLSTRWSFYFLHLLPIWTSRPVMQRASQQEEGEGHCEGVHAAVQRAPWHRVCRWILKLYPWTLT